MDSGIEKAKDFKLYFVGIKEFTNIFDQQYEMYKLTEEQCRSIDFGEFCEKREIKRLEMRIQAKKKFALLWV